MMNTWEISRSFREDNTLSHSNRPSMPLLELDEDEMEVFWNYWEQLKEIGVDPTDDHLQEALNGNIRNIEDAIRALIQYDSRPGHRWGDKSHPTTFLVKALREGWKPSKPKSSRT
jgi:hypothetical protein